MGQKTRVMNKDDLHALVDALPEMTALLRQTMGWEEIVQGLTGLPALKYNLDRPDEWAKNVTLWWGRALAVNSWPHPTPPPPPDC